MRKYILLSVIFIITLLLSFSYIIPVAASKTYYAERYDVHIDIQTDGTLLITETIAFHFEGGPFTYVFRNLSHAGLDDIEFREAKMDGLILTAGYGIDQVEIDEGDSTDVTWHFSPVSDSTHTFVITYKVTGAIRKLKSDALMWRAIPEEHGYPVRRAEITLTYPASVSLLQPPTLDRPYTIEHIPNGLRLTTNDLGEDDVVVLTALFPDGSLISSPPAWQVRKEREKAAIAAAIPVGVISFVASLVVGGLILWYMKNVGQRERAVPPMAPYTTPPQDLAPALVSKILGIGNPIEGTLFDFTRRGIIEVEENEGKKPGRSISFVRKPFDGSLRPHEQVFIEGLIPRDDESIDLLNLGKRIVHLARAFDQSLESELDQMGLFDPARKRQRNLMLTFWAFLLAIAIALCFTIPLTGLYLLGNESSVYTIASISIGVCSGISLVAIVGLFYVVNFSVLTPLGDEQALRWKSYRSYLQKVGQGIENVTDPDNFDQYLPYAAAFGFAEGWIKNCQEMGLASLPEWLRSQASDGGFSALYSVVNTLDTSTSSDSGGGGGDSGGASGGGSSGAG